MWLLFAGLNPFADAIRNVFSKKASRNVDSLLVSWFNNLIPLIFFSPVIFLIELKFSQEFFISVSISGVANITAAILYHRAIAKGDISLVVPMLSFTPLFLLLTSPLLIGEFPDTSGLLGILFIVVGSYLLNAKFDSRNIFAPFKALLKNKGTRYMLIVSFVWSLSANFDKRSINASSVWQHLFFINLIVFCGTTTFLLLKGKLNFAEIKLEKKNLLMVGFLTSCGFFLHMNALSLTLVAYVIALKRTAGMISVFLGYFFLDEKNIRNRLLGAAVMFIGVLFIILL